MKVDIRRSRLLLAGLVRGLVGLSLFAGCAELITYSGKSTEEGDKLAAAGKTEEAAGAYRNATQQNPRAYQAFYKLGTQYEKLDREQQALQSYHAAIDVMPGSPVEKYDVAFRDQAVNGLAGCIAKSQSRDAEVAAITDKAGKTNRPIDWYVVARTYVAAGDADNAIDAYEKAMIAADAKDQAIAKSFGLYLAQIGQTKKAEATLSKAYQLDPLDEEVNAALRKLGVVPGPSLLEEDQLHHPLIPKGPLPELELNVKDKNHPPAAPAPE